MNFLLSSNIIKFNLFDLKFYILFNIFNRRYETILILIPHIFNLLYLFNTKLNSNQLKIYHNYNNY